MLVRKLFTLAFLLISLNIFPSDCDTEILRLKLLIPFQIRYSALNKGTFSFSDFEKFSIRKLRELLAIADDAKFYEIVHQNFIEKSNFQKDIISRVSKNSLSKFIDNFNLEQLTYLSESTEVDVVSRYNQLFGTEYNELPEPDYQGSEGQLYRTKKSVEFKYKNLDIVLKVWKNSPEQFNSSSVGLEILYNIIKYSSTSLKNNIYVVKTFEFGPNYIVREFYNGKAIELSKAIKANNRDYIKYKYNIANNKKLKPEDYTNIALVKMVKSINLLGSLVSDPSSEYYINPLLRNLRFFMRKANPSRNLLWDPVAEKIVVIDTPGY